MFLSVRTDKPAMRVKYLGRSKAKWCSYWKRMFSRHQTEEAEDDESMFGVDD